MATPNQLLADLTQHHVCISASGEDCEYTSAQIKYALARLSDAITTAYSVASGNGNAYTLGGALLKLSDPIPSPPPQV